MRRKHVLTRLPWVEHVYVSCDYSVWKRATVVTRAAGVDRRCRVTGSWLVSSISLNSAQQTSPHRARPTTTTTTTTTTARPVFTFRRRLFHLISIKFYHLLHIFTAYSCCVLSTWILNVRSICIAYEYGYEHYITLHKTFIVRNHTETIDCALLILWATFTLLSLLLCLECYNRPYNLTPEKCDNNYSPHPLTPTSCLRNNIQRITDVISPCGCL